MRKSKKESVSVAYRLISNLWEEKIDDFAVTIMNMIDRVGYKIGETGLLTYPDYVIWKGFETIIDIHWIRAGLKWNVRAVPFYPLRISYPQENDQSHNDMKYIVETRNICKEIDKSIPRNETL